MAMTILVVYCHSVPPRGHLEPPAPPRNPLGGSLQHGRNRGQPWPASRLVVLRDGNSYRSKHLAGEGFPFAGQSLRLTMMCRQLETHHLNLSCRDSELGHADSNPGFRDSRANGVCSGDLFCAMMTHRTKSAAGETG